ncbi:MAG TPA: hypothetical protein VFC63_29115 [Blastocatellia bacterium]|nr:hypothetical protein [Blastocatellia bacterium]
MSAYFIIPILLLAIVALAIYQWQRTLSNKANDSQITPARHGGLFSVEEKSEARVRPLKNKQEQEAERPGDLIARARSGDMTALVEANEKGDRNLYYNVLDALADWASESPEQLKSLASYVIENDGLRSNRNLAQSLIEIWQSAPSRRLTADMLRVAALSDDADSYEEAVEMALLFWRNDAFRMTADELRSLIEAEYWLLSAEARSSGAGFMLKRKLAEARRELSAADRRAVN